MPADDIAATFDATTRTLEAIHATQLQHTNKLDAITAQLTAMDDDLAQVLALTRSLRARNSR
ncbi:hypothetical protein [Actinoplanes sp. N902-109]|uniref:hypothetical protein n=1 Tax=Actinoplanes sp. (strain N902-109) TaxID=649831 RepID=UPI0003293919|nr:hypothetical protein [Actinoplanes sp. N902-109]AGL14398.1 hypothetical protein L083_0888 [Actinoplanes sp. N902-109]